MNKVVFSAIIFHLFTSSHIVAETLLPFVSEQNRVKTDYREILQKTWKGIKRRNIDTYSISAVHRPFSEIPGDFLSEGIGYGMFLALYSNDQEYFNKIWDAGEKYMWSGSSYNWRYSENGSELGSGPATDAEEDVACMLIFADKLVEKGIWKSYISVIGASYAERAQDILDAFWDNSHNWSVRGAVVGASYNLAPWKGGYDQINIGYFAPAFYRIFKEFDSRKHDWDKLIDANYSILETNPGYSKGLVPDWINVQGSLLSSRLGYNSYDNGNSLYKDAIRIYWRIANDYLWFGEPRAKQFLDNAFKFIKEKGGAKAANFYNMRGELLPIPEGTISSDSSREKLTHVWTEMHGGNTWRSRREHSHLTVGMWAPVALVSGTEEDAEAFSEELLSFYEGGDYWGKKSSAEDYGANIIGLDGKRFYEDIEHNEMYFDQFLAWFGAALISGNWINVIAELDKEDWNKPAELKVDVSIGLAGNYIEISAELTKYSDWTVVIKNRNGDEIKKIDGYTKEIKVNEDLSGDIDVTNEVKLSIEIQGEPIWERSIH